MLDIGFQELIVVMVVALLVFGPDRLPELGRRLGRAMREFRRASDEFRSTVETSLQLHEESPLPTVSLEPEPAPALHPAAGQPESVASDPPAGAAEAGAPLGSEAAASDISGDGAPPPAPEPLEPYWMRRGGRLLHRSGCGWGGRVPEEERVGLKSADEGRELSLLGCPSCEPGGAEAAG